ncbi:LacI family DNA-binding transcriptional regulator [Actinopolymorpha alba]|uniref:LacI family DNA-binding transcriptional regulator n=1 Tax=Actinopolymorpha alba TaxID=533267 RepID=UPI00036AC92E|nr:LacI family DNA-binding transcriptional regulator [Actinopolymorpha alba]
MARATIKTVAQAAGVSISSVSRALNGQTSNPDTVARVRAAAAQVGYLPSAAAQTLKTRHTGQIAFAMEDIGNPAYLAMVRAIQPLLRSAGYRLLLHSTGADVGEEIQVLESLNQHYVDGLVLCPIRVTDRHLAALAQTAVPVVVIGSLPETVDVDAVRADSRTGTRLAVEHLAAAGCRDIALVNGPADTTPGSARYAGYVDGLRSAGLPVRDELVRFTNFHIAGGLEATKDLLAGTPIDGLVGANDRIAIGAMQALREAGRVVPRDVKVVGIDDTELAATAYPPLTSVDLGAAQRGQLAAQLLLDRLAGRAAARTRVAVEPSLNIRESSR